MAQGYRYAGVRGGARDAGNFQGLSGHLMGYVAKAAARKVIFLFVFLGQATVRTMLFASDMPSWKVTDGMRCWSAGRQAWQGSTRVGGQSATHL